MIDKDYCSLLEKNSGLNPEILKRLLILNIPWSFLTNPGAHWHPLTHDLDVLVVKWYWFKFILELSRLIWPDRPIGHPFVNISSIIASICSVLLKDNLFYIFMLFYIRCTSSWTMFKSGEVLVWGYATQKHKIDNSSSNNSSFINL